MAALLVLVHLVLLPFLAGQVAEARQLIVEKHSFGSFGGAYRILVTAQNWIYVLDRSENRIVLFRDGQTNPTTIGGYGWGSSSFDGPSGIASDGLNLYISDYGNHRIQRFDRTLSFISSFSTRESENPQVRFGYPSGVDLSRQGDLLLLDGENSRVLRFSPRSLFLGSFGDIEIRSRRLRRPLKIVASHTDRVYVLEPNRLIEYDHVGNFLRSIGEGELKSATSVVLVGQSFIVIEPHSVSVFGDDGLPKRRIARDSLVVEQQVDEFADAAIVETEFYLLTRHRVHVFDLADIVKRDKND